MAEKNDAAKNIAGLLSGGARSMREGFSRFNKIYEFKCRVQGRDADMSMTSVSGHMLNYDFEEKYRKWHSCAPSQLFQGPHSI